MRPDHLTTGWAGRGTGAGPDLAPAQDGRGQQGPPSPTRPRDLGKPTVGSGPDRASQQFFLTGRGGGSPHPQAPPGGEGPFFGGQV